LFDELHELHHRAGWPSLREMAAEVGCSHTTISVAFTGPRPPRWGLLELIVETLGGDTERFHDLWLAASRATDSAPAAATDAAPAASATPTTPAAPAAASSEAVVPVASTAAPRELPADVVGFTGRVEQLAELDELLDAEARGVIIAEVSGTAGVGKTALAVHWAHRVAQRFPDGQLYVNLRGYDPDKPLGPDEALEAFLRELGVDGSAIPPEVAQRAARYRSLLAGRHMLVLLDNANSVDQIRDLLPGTPSCLVLVTSRDTLPGLVARYGAHRVDLDLLPIADATALLRRLIGRRVSVEPDAAEALAQQCARLPLALRIAAELATSRPSATLAELVAELDEQKGRLDLFAAGDDDYTAVRAVFSWSQRQLDDDAARAFALLGLHPGADIDVHAAAALFDVPAPEARRMLDVLARAHLLDVRGRARFGMHDLLRAYAAELGAQLAEPQRQAAGSRLFEHYLATASTIVDSSDPRGWIEAERANLLAVSAAATSSRPSLTVGLAVTLIRYLDARAYYTEAQVLAGLALDAARDIDDQASEAVVLNLLGGVHYRIGHYGESRQLHEKALTLHRRLGDRSGEGLALYGLGIVAYRSGQYLDALDRVERALQLFREVGDRTSEGHALYSLGVVELRLGRHAAALEHELEAVAVNRETGDRTAEGRSLSNAGEVLLRLRRYEEARSQYQQSLRVAYEVGNHAGQSVALENLGTVAVELGELDDALGYYHQALAISTDVGYRLGRADALRGIGLAYGRQKRYDEAVDYLRQAVEVADEIGEAGGRTLSLNDLGAVLVAAGRSDDAAETYRAALELARTSADRYEQACAHRGLATVLDEPQAAEHRNAAIDIFDELGLPDAEEIRRTAS
jgi:tetratricopeptide (TPR) repeat protein